MPWLCSIHTHIPYTYIHTHTHTCIDTVGDPDAMAMFHTHTHSHTHIPYTYIYTHTCIDTVDDPDAMAMFHALESEYNVTKQSSDIQSSVEFRRRVYASNEEEISTRFVAATHNACMRMCVCMWNFEGACMHPTTRRCLPGLLQPHMMHACVHVHDVGLEGACMHE